MTAMTIIGGKQHPRHPDWLWMMCDECFQNYWTDQDLRSSKHHLCSGCRSPNTHFTSGFDTERESADRLYHGDRFTSGER